MFWIRFRSSCILMAITITAVILGGNVLFAAVLGISLIGMSELYRIIKIEKASIGILGYLFCMALYTLLLIKQDEYLVMLFVGFLLVLMIFYVVTFPKYKADSVALAFFGLFYVALMLSYIYRVRMLEDGAIVVWLIFIGAWGSDTCAYLVGITMGKRRIFPELSPKKSLEGCIGGVLGAALLGGIYATIFKNQIAGFHNPQVAFAIIGGASSILSQIGDLAASAIKRNYNIKDYGKLLPGHGGILDRFDSIIFTAPIVFYLATLLGI